TNAITGQFAECSARRGGGLLMRATASEGEMSTFLNSVPPDGTSHEELKARQHNLEKYAYIRADTSMRTFGSRPSGIMLDPNPVWQHVRMNGDRLAIYAEDAVSGACTKPTIVADTRLSQEDVANGFDGVVTSQHE